MQTRIECEEMFLWFFERERGGEIKQEEKSLVIKKQLDESNI